MNVTELMAKAVMVLIPMVLSLTVHEYAHAFVARRLGDDTAERAGRLTLNPLSHIDPVGTLLLPFMLLVGGGMMGGRLPFLGWAKPTPVDAGRFRRDVSVRRGSVMVSAVGPLSNVVLAVVCAALRSLSLHGWLGEAGLPDGLDIFLQSMVFINIGLFIFNLLPIAPLDGQQVVSGLLAPTQALRFEQFNQRYGNIALWCVILFAGRLLTIPVVMVASGVNAVVGLGP